MGHSFIVSNPLLPIAVCLIVGIMIGLSLPFPLYTYLIVFLLVLLLTLSVGSSPRLQSLLIFAEAVIAGGFCATYHEAVQSNYAFWQEQRPCLGIIASEKTEKERSVAFDVVLAEDGRKIKCYFEGDEYSRCLAPGNGIQLEIALEPFAEQLSDGFRYRRYMSGHGFSGQCYVGSSHWQSVQVSASQIPLLTRVRIVCLQLRHNLLERYRLLGADDDRYGVLAAMTLGDKSALSAATRDTYSISGASHILALSGMHLGILYMLFSMFFFRHGRQSVWAQALLAASVWAFAMLTGLSASVVRASIMISLFSIFSIGFRTEASLNLLCLAAIIILTGNPYALLDIGFQLSFMSVLAILIFVPLTKTEEHNRERREWTLKERIIKRSRKAATSFLCVSLAAQMGVAPLLAFYFGRFSTYFLIANLIVIPAAYLILYGSLLMLLIPWPPLARLVIGSVDLLNTMLTKMNRWPMASIEGLEPSVLQVIICYLIFLCLAGMLAIWKRSRENPAIPKIRQ